MLKGREFSEAFEGLRRDVAHERWLGQVRVGPRDRQSTESLVAYIERHGFEAEAQGNGIAVSSASVNRAGDAELHHEIIPPTLAAVREWLGY